MINIKSYKPTLSRPTAYNRGIESDPRLHKKSFDNERDQYLDWEAFKQNNEKMLIAHDIIIHKVLSHVNPTSEADIKSILMLEYLIDGKTVENVCNFIRHNSKFVEWESSINEHVGISIAYLKPKQQAPTASYSVFVPKPETRRSEIHG